MEETKSKIPIWLDCDTGHDDAFAILLAAHHPQANLLGLSTVHGNAPVTETTPNTLAVLQAIGRSSIPVVQGNSRPLEREPSFATEMHGDSGLALHDPSLLPKAEERAVHDMQHAVDTLLAQPQGSAWIVSTGPLTNVAHLMELEPRLAHHICGLSAMGGAIGGDFTDAPSADVEGHGKVTGNWTPHAEFNLVADPEAASKVFSNPVLAQKTTLVTLDLTHQVRGTIEVRKQLFGEQHHGDGQRSLSRLRRLMREILMYFASSYEQQQKITDGPPLHDPLAAWAAICPESFGTRADSVNLVPADDDERWHVDVTIEPGRADIRSNSDNRTGQTVLRKADGLGVRVPRSVDIPHFWDEIDDALKKAESCLR
ncbi:MAG: Uridine nucleosidase 1 [Alyxoria varia]|nr:MAG: Uridine nucleosidase 1 [Alyxoria varia]